MQTNHQAPGLTLTVSSDLPLGCGLGSSASVLAALMTALNRCFALEWDKAELYRETLVLENLQHGHSSGTDLTLCLEGGCLYIENGQTQLRPLPTLPFFLVNTGKPQCSTGECVEYASVLLQDGSLHEAFANSTQALDKALTQQDHASANKALRHNHRLLCQIGVVPKTIQGFIHAIEEKGLAAKICGSGAIFGEQAGILLVLGEKDKAASLLESYNYEAIDLLGDAHGTRIL